MKFIVFAAVLILVLAGCRSSSPATDDSSAAQADSSKLYTKAVHVLVDGRDMGIIPMTLRIRRSFGTREVTLWQAGEEIRTYEIEIHNTTEGEHTLQGFWSTPSMDGASFDVDSLPKDGDDIYLIPFTPQPIRVEDRAYGVTLLVSE